MKVTATIDIQNMPRNINHNYLVVRQVDGGVWYYGQYDNEKLAKRVATELGNGFVIERKEQNNG